MYFSLVITHKRGILNITFSCLSVPPSSTYVTLREGMVYRIRTNDLPSEVGQVLRLPKLYFVEQPGWRANVTSLSHREGLITSHLPTRLAMLTRKKKTFPFEISRDKLKLIKISTTQPPQEFFNIKNIKTQIEWPL